MELVILEKMLQLAYTGRSPWGDRGVVLSSSRPPSRVVTQTLLGRFKSWPMPVEDHTPPDAFHIILDWCRHKKIIITGMTDDMVDLAGLRAVAE